MGSLVWEAKFDDVKTTYPHGDHTRRDRTVSVAARRYLSLCQEKYVLLGVRAYSNETVTWIATAFIFGKSRLLATNFGRCRWGKR
jgi:hypothetical protein